jgi:hypothetical protein
MDLQTLSGKPVTSENACCPDNFCPYSPQTADKIRLQPDTPGEQSAFTDRPRPLPHQLHPPSRWFDKHTHLASKATSRQTGRAPRRLRPAMLLKAEAVHTTRHGHSPGSWRRRAGTGHECDWKEDASGGSGCSVDAGEDGLDRLTSHVLLGQRHRCQTDHRPRAHRYIIDAGHRQVIRNADPEITGRVERAESHGVVGADDGSWPLRARQDLQRQTFPVVV